jgi:DNA-binding response OmpR family regulator
MKVLLIEDDKECVLFVRRALEKKFGCEVIVAENGLRGLFHLNKSNPDIVLLDIALPVMNGFEMLDILKINTETKFPPVIVISALWEKDIQATVSKMNVYGYIAKPIQIQKLIDIIEDALGAKEHA